jgi:hypothetical protein
MITYEGDIIYSIFKKQNVRINKIQMMIGFEKKVSRNKKVAKNLPLRFWEFIA